MTAPSPQQADALSVRAVPRTVEDGRGRRWRLVTFGRAIRSLKAALVTGVAALGTDDDTALMLLVKEGVIAFGSFDHRGGSVEGHPGQPPPQPYAAPR